MIRALITGKLYNAPERKTSRAGKDYGLATVSADTNEGKLFVRVMLFGDACERLLELDRGDPVAAVGQLKAEIYQKEGGEPRVSLTLLADELLDVRSRRKPKTEEADEPF